jgi:hypothetical protein
MAADVLCKEINFVFLLLGVQKSFYVIGKTFLLKVLISALFAVREDNDMEILINNIILINLQRIVKCSKCY